MFISLCIHKLYVILSLSIKYSMHKIHFQAPPTVTRRNIELPNNEIKTEMLYLYIFYFIDQNKLCVYINKIIMPSYIYYTSSPRMHGTLVRKFVFVFFYFCHASAFIYYIYININRRKIGKKKST